MAKQTEIESALVRGGLRGRMDKLQQAYLQKAQALLTAIQILDAEDRATAQALAPKKFLQAINHRNGNGDFAEAPAPKKRKKKKFIRLTVDQRKAQVATFLMAHPDGGSADDIGAALGIDRNMIYKYAPMVAKAAGTDDNGRTVWVLKNGAPTKRTLAGQAGMKAKKAKKILRQPKQERLDQIQGYLQRHPEARTVEIAKAMGMRSGGSFKKLLRSIAHPTHRTKNTQPITWVLNG